MAPTAPKVATPRDEHDPLAGIAGEHDLKYEEEGAWFEHAPADGSDPGPNQVEGYRAKVLDAAGNGLKRVHVVSRHSDKYLRENDRFLRAVANLAQEQRDPAVRAHNARMLGKHALRGWELTSPSGEVIPFTPELGLRLMTEPRYRDHRAFVLECVLRIEREVVAAHAADERD